MFELLGKVSICADNFCEPKVTKVIDKIFNIISYRDDNLAVKVLLVGVIIGTFTAWGFGNNDTILQHIFSFIIINSIFYHYNWKHIVDFKNILESDSPENSDIYINRLVAMIMIFCSITFGSIFSGICYIFTHESIFLSAVGGELFLGIFGYIALVLKGYTPPPITQKFGKMATQGI